MLPQLLELPSSLLPADQALILLLREMEAACRRSRAPGCPVTFVSCNALRIKKRRRVCRTVGAMWPLNTYVSMAMQTALQLLIQGRLDAATYIHGWRVCGSLHCAPSMASVTLFQDAIIMQCGRPFGFQYK